MLFICASLLLVGSLPRYKVLALLASCAKEYLIVRVLMRNHVPILILPSNV